MGLFGKKTEASTLLSNYLRGDVDTMTVDIALQVPAVARCVDMIAGAVAQLPVKLYKRVSDGVEEIKEDKRLTLLNIATGDTMTADNMHRMWVRDYLLTGSAYAYIDGERRLVYVPSTAVTVLRKDYDHLDKRFTYRIDGKEIFPYQMLKMLRNSNGYGKGVGIISESPLIINTMFQLLKFQKNQVLKGGNKKGFFKSISPLKKEVADNIKQNWMGLNSNDGRTESVMLLNGDIDFKEMSCTSVEMQLNENVKTNDSEIMALFGTLDGILSPDTVKNAVLPVLNAFEAAFDSDLLTEKEKGTYYFAFDTRELTRGDVQSRYSAYAVALQNNFMQLDEVRAAEDLPPLGFNYIKLGLNDVLLNPVTKEVYTPNTNATADLDNLGDMAETGLTDGEKRGIIEDRDRRLK